MEPIWSEDAIDEVLNDPATKSYAVPILISVAGIGLVLLAIISNC